MPHKKDQRGTVNHTLILVYLLFVLFVGLKLTGHITWSWWLVFAPLWGYALTAIVIGFVAGFIGAYRAARQNAAERDKKFDDAVNTLRRKGSNPPSPYTHSTKPPPPPNPPATRIIGH